jgi:hypothetical protein
MALQRTVGNRASASIVGGAERRLSRQPLIDPNEEFSGPARPANKPPAAIEAGELDESGKPKDGGRLTGFGMPNPTGRWHTTLTFGTLERPTTLDHEDPKFHLEPEGSGVEGVIGPEHPFGSEPSIPARGNARKLTARFLSGKVFVAAHIVNDILGGPGEPTNLFAFPSSGNTAMELGVESKMKAAVREGHFIFYKATVNRRRDLLAESITMSWHPLDEKGGTMPGGQEGVKIPGGLPAEGASSPAAAAAPPAAAPAAAAAAAAEEARSAASAPEADAPPDASVAAAPKRGDALVNPTDIGTITATPWAWFQMPDTPGGGGGVSKVHLDFTGFPAVATAESWRTYLEAGRYTDTGLQECVKKIGSAPLEELARRLDSRSLFEQEGAAAAATRMRQRKLPAETRAQLESSDPAGLKAVLAFSEGRKVAVEAAGVFAAALKGKAGELYGAGAASPAAASSSSPAPTRRKVNRDGAAAAAADPAVAEPDAAEAASGESHADDGANQLQNRRKRGSAAIGARR